MTGAIPHIVSPTEILVTVEKCWSRHGRGDLGAGLASVGLAEGLFMTEQNGPFHLTEMQLAQDEDEVYDDEDDELEDDEEEFEDEEDEYEDEEEEEVAGGGDVEAIYEEADILLDEFQDYLKGRGIAREDRARYDETLQVFVDDYLAAYEVGKLTDMNRDEIDTYLQDYLMERERIPKRKLADTKETFAIFYTFLCEHGHIAAAVAGPIIQYCQA